MGDTLGAAAVATPTDLGLPTAPGPPTHLGVPTHRARAGSGVAAAGPGRAGSGARAAGGAGAGACGGSMISSSAGRTCQELLRLTAMCSFFLPFFS